MVLTPGGQAPADGEPQARGVGSQHRAQLRWYLVLSGPHTRAADPVQRHLKLHSGVCFVPWGLLMRDWTLRGRNELLFEVWHLMLGIVVTQAGTVASVFALVLVCTLVHAALLK